MSKKIRVYLSGKITGEKDTEVKAKFSTAQMLYEGMGYDVLNPIEFTADLKPTSPWETYMKICVCHLTTADAVVLLHDWQHSKGATIEKRIADDLNIPCFPIHHKITVK